MQRSSTSSGSTGAEYDAGDRTRRFFESVAAATRFRGRARFTWFGQAVAALPSGYGRLVDASAARAARERALARTIYSCGYLVGRPVPMPLAPRRGGRSARSDFARELAVSDRGRGRGERNWVVVAAEGDRLTVARNGVTLRAPRDRCASAEGGLGPGTQVTVRFPKLRRQASPGFYVAFSESDAGSQPGPRLRCYFNVTSSGAGPILRGLTELLDDAAQPFELKALADPNGYDRLDPVVLYVPPGSGPAVLEVVERALPRFEAHLQTAVPPFTFPLWPGIGIAEDPGSGSSFGQHRCQLVAQGLLEARESGARTLRGRVEAIGAAFEAGGVDPARPWHRVGGALDDVAMLRTRHRPASRERGSPKHASVRRPADRHEEPDPLETALDIGRRLTAEARRAQGLCTWVARLDESLHEHPAAGGRARFGTLGADLYGGLAGIALFLAELAAATGDAHCRETARSAARHALSQVGSSVGHGFYNGTAGVLWGVSRAATLLEDEAMGAAARRTAWETVGRLDERVEGAGFDLIDGLAGTLVGWLALSGPGEDRLLEAAVRVGDALARRATPETRGAAWRGAAGQRIAPVGLAHGASGAALALSDLADAMGDERFRDLASEAVLYEREWYDAGRGWVDTRLANAGKVPLEMLPTSVSWCYGSTGLLGARTGMIPAGGSVADDASQAATQCVAGLAAGLDRPNDWSRCHGLAGTAEMLVVARRAGVPLPLEAARLTRRTAWEAGRRWRRRELSLFSRSGRVARPGLMTGAAGLGSYLLRQAGASEGSILVPTRRFLRAFGD